MSNTKLCAFLFFVHIVSAVGFRYEIVISCINICINIIVGYNVAYSRPITYNIIFMCIVLVLGSLMIYTLFNILLIKIGEVNRRLKESSAQHANLLNGMHEGLIILSNATKDSPLQFEFCNNSAKKLISTFLGPIEKCNEGDPKVSSEVQRRIMQNENFNLLKLKKNDTEPNS